MLAADLQEPRAALPRLSETFLQPGLCLCARKRTEICGATGICKTAHQNCAFCVRQAKARELHGFVHSHLRRIDTRLNRHNADVVVMSFRLPSDDEEPLREPVGVGVQQGQVQPGIPGELVVIGGYKQDWPATVVRHSGIRS